jgi:uncharacterized membrane protein HdeD (DUF308 family)
MPEFDMQGRSAVAPRAVSTAWGMPFFLGLAVAVLGFICFIFAGITGVASVIFFGALLAVAGVVEIADAFRDRRRGSLTLPLLSGLLSLVVGVLLLARPLVGLAAAGLLLAGYLFATGLFRGITSLVDRYAQWGWDFLYGVLAVILGVVLFSNWPLSSLWLLGALIGIEMMARGVSIMGSALVVRRVVKTRPAAARA